MKIDGINIANDIYKELKVRVTALKEKGIAPQIAVILIGDNPASISYIAQKKKFSELIGIKFILSQFPSNLSKYELLLLIDKLNKDAKVHGIIVQRPLPKQIPNQKVVEAIDLKKDIDGFRIDSPFDPPVAKAVYKVLEEIYHSINNKGLDFSSWLKAKSITVLGRGVTAGGPIIKFLQKMGLKPQIITSQTANADSIIKSSDIIITAVGKPEVIKPGYLKTDVILIGVGMYKGSDDKLYGDYIVQDIKDAAAMYTPVTGGIGPVNVAYLLKNLVTAAESIK